MSVLFELAGEELGLLKSSVPEREFQIGLAAATLLMSLENPESIDTALSIHAMCYLLSEIECDANVAQTVVEKVMMLNHALVKADNFDMESILK